MATTPNKIVVDVQLGPTLRFACDVLEKAGELLELVPDWHEAEREELRARMHSLYEAAVSELRSKNRQ